MMEETGDHRVLAHFCWWRYINAEFIIIIIIMEETVEGM